MKIAVPMNKKDITLPLADIFARASYFLILNTENNAHHFLENTALNQSGGAGILAAQALIDAQIDVLIAPQCGKNASDILQEADIKIYTSKRGSATENIFWYKKNLLQPLANFRKTHHGEVR